MIVLVTEDLESEIIGVGDVDTVVLSEESVSIYSTSEVWSIGDSFVH